MAKKATVLIESDQQDEEIVEQPKVKEFKSRRGAKLLTTPKPKGAARSLYDSPHKSSHPVTVYKEMVTDANTGESSMFIWWHQADSVTVGKEEIVKWSPKTDEEITVGYDYTIPYTKENRDKILKLANRGTVFVDKTTGRDAFAIRNPQTDF